MRTFTDNLINCEIQNRNSGCRNPLQLFFNILHAFAEISRHYPSWLVLVKLAASSGSLCALSNVFAVAFGDVHGSKMCAWVFLICIRGAAADTCRHSHLKDDHLEGKSSCCCVWVSLHRCRPQTADEPQLTSRRSPLI